jgi:hypothetical protein
MIRTVLSSRRGLSLLELLLSLSITVMVAGAICGMLGAVTSGVETRADTRSIMLSCSAAQQRLGAYICPARCILGKTDSSLAVWFNDDRATETVHASEIRWLRWNDATGNLSVYLVVLPEEWTDIEQEIADLEYSEAADWEAVFADYSSQGYVKEVPLCDGLDSVTIDIDTKNPMVARQVSFTLGYEANTGTQSVRTFSSIRQLRTPKS